MRFAAALAAGVLLVTPLPAQAHPVASDGPDTTLTTPWERHVSAKKKPKKKRVYTTPGYKPKRKVVPVTPVEPPARPLIQLADAVTEPRVLLDAAGTAHITWVERGTPDRPGDVEVYCRLPRGASACDSVKRWPEAYLPNIGVTNINGVQPLALGDDLALVSSRYPYDGVPIPGRPPNNTPEYEDATATFLDFSADGGTTFAPRTWIGDMSVHDAAVFGPPEAPSILGITDTVTGGTSVQAYTGGQTSVATALLGPGVQAYDGRVASEGGVPIAAWTDANANGWLGRWSGSGSPNDVATWQRAEIGPAGEPSLATGPAGTLLLAKPGLSGIPQLRRVNGVTVSDPVTMAPGDFATVEQDGAGGVYVGSVDPGTRGTFQLQRGDGTAFGGPVTVATAPTGQAFSTNRFAVLPDGGGVVVMAGSGGIYNPLYVTSFGTLAPTGQLGLGGRAGEGLVGPEATVECGRIAFGAVEMRTSGCFFTATRTTATSGLTATRSIRVAQGPVDLNGLWVRPDNGVQIQIDPAAKTIDTTGTVSVQLDAGGGPITVWRGELHLKLPKPNEKTLLASFDTSAYAAALKGFPISGRIDVELTDKGVRIPVNLKLPKAFGDARGEAVLRAQVGSGLQLDSLRIEINEAYLAGPTLRDVLLEYTAGNDTWVGSGQLIMPPGRGSLGIGVSVRFVAGGFRDASAEVTIPYPGLPLFKGVYLWKVRGGFGLQPTKISVGGTIGIIPVVAGQTFLVDSSADATITFGTPWEVSVRGGSTVLELIPVSRVKATVNGDGFVAYDGQARLKLGSNDLGVGGGAGLGLAFDLPSGQFSGRFQSGSITLYVPDPFPDVDLNIADIVISSRGVGMCVGGAGFRYRFSDKDLTLFPPLGSCNLGPIQVVLTPRQSQALRAGHVAASGVRLSGGVHAYLHIDGVGGAPAVSLIDPKGRRIDPVRPTTVTQAKRARVVALSADNQTIVSIRNPRKGNWQVVAADGSVIQRIRLTESAPSPRLSTRIVRTGGKVSLRYTLRGGKDLGAIISERTRTGTSRVLGTVKAGSGALRIPAGTGPGGRRTLTAIITRDGIPVDHASAGRYSAPPPARPGKVTGVRIVRKGQGVVVRWRKARGADAYVVVVRSGDGLSRRITTGPKSRGVRVTGIDRDDRAAVSLQAVASTGRVGPTARDTLPAPKPKKKKRS